MRILVVDDIGYTRHYHARLLERHGFTLRTAEGGRDALAAIAEHDPFDAVLTDLLMPDMDGTELFEHTRQLCARADRPVPNFVLMTAFHATAQSHSRDLARWRAAMDLEFAKVFAKPIDPERLVTLLRSLPPPRRLPPELPNEEPADNEPDSSLPTLLQLPDVRIALRDAALQLMEAGDGETALAEFELIRRDIDQLGRVIRIGSL